MIDAISDMISRIRNAQLARHQTVEMPASNLRWRISELLEKEGYIVKAEKRGKIKGGRTLEITLKYEDGVPVIRELRRISKPGRRWYADKSEMLPKRSGRRLIVSTSQGIVTDKVARKLGVGGEILFEIW